MICSVLRETFDLIDNLCINSKHRVPPLSSPWPAGVPLRFPQNSPAHDARALSICFHVPIADAILKGMIVARTSGIGGVSRLLWSTLVARYLYSLAKSLGMVDEDGRPLFWTLDGKIDLRLTH